MIHNSKVLDNADKPPCLLLCFIIYRIMVYTTIPSMAPGVVKLVCVSRRVVPRCVILAAARMLAYSAL